MGKASRKMAKQQQKKEGKNRAQDIKTKEEICRTQITEEKFDEALGTIAEIAQTGHKDEDIMYLAAYCYFMTGDYDRAATWINNTLSYDGGHLKARILLARLCMLQERDDDGLAIFDFVLEYGEKSLAEEDVREIKEILEYYVRNEADKIQMNYPHIAAFVHLPEPYKVKTTIEQTTLDDICESKNFNVNEATMQEKGALLSSDELWKENYNEIMGKSVSLLEKIRLLNVFSGTYYFKKDMIAAQSLLKAALELDAFNDMSLHNMIILQQEIGNMDLALEYAARLSKPDFQILQLLRNCEV